MAKVVRLTSELAKEARKNFVLLFRIHDDGNHSAKGVGEKDVSTRTGFESMQNPLRVLRLLDGYQWLMLSTASFALFADYFDIYGLSIQTVKISAYYNISKVRLWSSGLVGCCLVCKQNAKSFRSLISKIGKSSAGHHFLLAAAEHRGHCIWADGRFYGTQMAARDQPHRTGCISDRIDLLHEHLSVYRVASFVWHGDG